MANAPRGARSTLKLNAATAKTLIKNAIEDWGYPNSPFRVKALKTALHRGSLTQLDSDPDTLCAKLVFSKAEVVVEQMPEPVKQGEATNMDQLSGKKSTNELASADEGGVSAGEQSMGPVTSEDATNMVSADSIGGEIIIELLLRNLVKHVPTFGRNMSLGRGSNRENLPLLLLVEKLRCDDSFAADNRDQMSWVLPYFLEWTRVSASGKETMIGPLLKCVILQVEQQLREVMALLAIANDVDGESFDVDEEPFVVSLFKEMVARALAERKIDGCGYSDKSLVVFLLLGWVMLSSIRCSVDVREESFLESLLQLAFRCYLEGGATRFDTLTEAFTSFLLEDVSFLEPSLISELSEEAKNVDERQGALLVILLLEVFAIEASANGLEDKVAGIFRTFCGD
jgi:hypothetical protein